MLFTYKNYRKICKSVINHKKTITANQLLNNKSADAEWIIFKHDIETNVNRALKLARIENSFGIKATYYVQGYLLKNNIRSLKKIAELGHELTYHYDVLDANQGDFEKAKQEFLDYLRIFESNGFKIKTICPHGNPLMNRDGWNSNKDFFRNKLISKEFNNLLDIVVQLPDLLNSEYTYISDAGFRFNKIVNIESNDINNNGDININSINEFRSISKEDKKIIFSTHPHRWRAYLISAIFNKGKFILIKKLALLLSRNKQIKKLLSKFYFLAKKI